MLSQVACKRDVDASPGYVVSIAPQRQILEQLVDSGTVVTTLISTGTDPETFEPTMSQRRAVADAVVYFGTGTLLFEETLASNARYCNTSEGIVPIYGTHTHEESAHSHDEILPDPHMWTSVSGVRVMARNMADALIAAEPIREEVYRTRLKRLEAHLDSLDKAIASRLATVRNRTFGIWHPSLSYMARDYGLRQLPLGDEGKDMSARGLMEAIDKARADSVKVFFIQREYGVRQAQAISDAIGSRLIVINPLDYDWEGQINLIADELARP